MNWIMRKVKALLKAIAILVGLVLLAIIVIYSLHAAGVIEDPAIWIEKIKAIDWKQQAGMAGGALIVFFFITSWMDEDMRYGGRYYGGYGGYGRGGIRHGDQVTYEDRNRNGIPDDFERY